MIRKGAVSEINILLFYCYYLSIYKAKLPGEQEAGASVMTIA